MNEIREIGVEEFIRRLKNLVEEVEDSKFAFFIGAGCSVSSGIPAAGTLVKSWLPRLKLLKTGDDSNYGEWVNEIYPEYEDDRASLFYGKVIEDLFFTADERQREIERLTEGKDPGFGYAVLAQLMTHETCGRHCNVILTVNFDDLIADAQYLYTHKKPLVISHEALVGFVRLTRTRPLVIKLHGDARLEPKNTEQETEELAESVKKTLKDLLSETGLIFIGYGGNDKSLANIFKELPSSAIPWGIYWIGDTIPDSDIGEWLKERNAIWVKHNDFDELMLLLWNEFDLKHPDDKRFARLLDTYYDTFKTLKTRVKAKPETAEKRIFERAAEKAVREFTSWMAVEFEADEYSRTNKEKAEVIYREGIKKFPDSYQLLNNYANLLAKIRKDYDKAEKYYNKALEADPTNVVILGNYALFLNSIRKDYDKAEEYYKKALDVDPNYANNLTNYSGFLLAQGKYREGFALLQKAFDSADDRSLQSLECSFYQYAHTKDEKARDGSLAKIKELIKSGIRSPGMDLTDNVKRAIEDGHPYPEFLDKLSRVISEEIEARELEAFDIWQTDQ